MKHRFLSNGKPAAPTEFKNRTDKKATLGDLIKAQQELMDADVIAQEEQEHQSLAKTSFRSR